jgi:2-polyprenyl-3-methyl-5-hydroxy-6-metoxy-1,4-benzoquinol methylase
VLIFLVAVADLRLVYDIQHRPLNDVLRAGDYARKQIYCPSRVVAWSHGSRFRLAARLAAAAGSGGRLLDFGCGDGTFIALTHGAFADVIGCDIDAAQLAECRDRLRGLDRVTFIHTGALAADAHAGAYDVVTCMEVLEHCVDAQRTEVLDTLRRVVKPAGRLIVSVPIEVGPALLGKQLFRAIAAWRGHGDYQHRETYSPRELAAAVLARPPLTRAEYDVQTPEGSMRYCGHKGFDWHVLEAEIARRFAIDERRFTPLPPLGAMLNSQVWFVCRPR